MSESGSGPSNHHVNEAKLEDLRALERPGNDGFVARILSIFLTDAGKRVEEIHTAVQRRDPQAVAMAAHTLKGSCLYVGANRLAEMCRSLEDLAAQGIIQEEQAAAIRRELVEVTAVLAGEVAKHHL